MASNKKNQKSPDNNPESDEEVIDGQEQAADEAQDGAADAVAEDEVAGIPDESEKETQVHTMTVKVDADDAMKVIRHHIASQGNLHSRLEKAARSLSTHGGQERVHALNQVELLTGRLKMALPAAISATDDMELKAALETLLGLL